jgi:hypothetical protein
MRRRNCGILRQVSFDFEFLVGHQIDERGVAGEADRYPAMTGRYQQSFSQPAELAHMPGLLPVHKYGGAIGREVVLHSEFLLTLLAGHTHPMKEIIRGDYRGQMNALKRIGISSGTNSSSAVRRQQEPKHRHV